jgi:hypothetical protein
MPDLQHDESDAQEAQRQREMQLLYQAVLQRSREHDELQAIFSQFMKYDDENQKQFNTRRDGGLNLI